MGEEGPSKTDLQAVFKKLRAAPANKVCFDCGARNPTWSSVTYGVFICIDCSATHRNLGVHITFVRSTQLDTNWTWLQMRAMQCGGNANATQFFKQHGCNTTDAQQKYKSRAASLYRDKLHQLSTQAMRLHGTKVHLDGPQLSPQPTENAVDFFEEHVQGDTPNMPHNLSEVSMSDDAYIGNQDAEYDGDGPSVDHINADDGTASSEARKSTLVAKKAAPKKATFGAKKGGLGAQRVKANFSEIEQKAANFDKEREENAKFTIAPESPEQTPDVNKLSARLMVQDIDDQRRKQEIKLKTQDPKKADQVDRLGMGGLGRGVQSHSVASGIKTIQQEGVRQKSNYNKSRDIDYTTKDDDDWEVLNKEPFGNGSSRSKSNKEDDAEEFTKKNSNDFFNSWDETPAEEKRPSRPAARSTYEPPAAASDASAYKKYANAKSISSDQFFGGGATDYETKSNLAKFEGSTGIGSADLFGNGSAKGGGGGGGNSAAGGAGYYGQVPEMADIKDSVRQGVGKVAGKISSIGSSFSSYLSDRY